MHVCIVVIRGFKFELPVKCPQCSSEISPHLTECSECRYQLGYPNVRHAQRPAEVDSLSVRYEEAVKEAKSRGCDDIRNEFENWVVSHTRPVICRNWGTVSPILSKPGDLFRTFYELIEAGERQPQDNEFDQARQAVDATFFPHFYQRVNFAALAGDGKGPASYGEIHFTFQESAVSHRTTVFEENTLVFCKKHKVIVGQSPPAGFLSTWATRGKLAIAKLSKILTKTTTLDDFPGILVVQSGKTDTDEFIECHIYGRLTISNIEYFRAQKPKLKADEVLAKRIMRKLRQSNVSEQPF